MKNENKNYENENNKDEDSVSIIKNFLINNKIYFETLVTFLLGVMAITVSFVSLSINRSQLRNEELLNQPLIKISNDIFSYNGIEKDSRFIIIENYGTPITEFSSTLFSFVRIETNINSDRSIERKNICIPISDYFGGYINNNNFTGEIAKYIGVNNYRQIDRIQNEFDRKYSNKYPQTFITIVLYLKISYNDYKGEPITKIYEIDEINGGKEIKETNKEYKQCLSIWMKGKKYYIHKMKADDIVSFIIKQKNE